MNVFFHAFEVAVLQRGYYVAFISRALIIRDSFPENFLMIIVRNGTILRCNVSKLLSIYIYASMSLYVLYSKQNVAYKSDILRYLSTKI